MINQIKVLPVIDVSVRRLCLRAYYGHRKGCPNYGKRATCPPQARIWTDVCNTSLATWIYFTRFNLADHRERMKAKHPNWSHRQLDCCLYWQKKARKPLREFLKALWLPGFYVTMCPEAMGVNVTKTMHEMGIDLEWPPVNYTYQVAMGGWLL